jgi:hypothetical protein
VRALTASAAILTPTGGCSAPIFAESHHVGGPAGLPRRRLPIARERAKLEEALADATERGAAEIHWVERATLSELLRALRGDEYHVFHYIGHGAYDTTLGDGVLLFEDEDGKIEPRM